jgi:Holliday junction resolvase
MKYGARIDANQPEIVAALRKAGCTVQHLHAVGDGCPDLLCAIDGVTFLIEVKDGAKIPSKQALTPAQVDWHAAWKSEVHIVNSVAGALAVAAFYKNRALKEEA